MDTPPEDHGSLQNSGPSVDLLGEVPGVDGTVDKVLKRGTKRPVTAIFVHAGAGYHSIQNEGVHLGACSDAARVAMQLLKRGCTAVEAVEAAVRILEDREVTNAGFGSNLTENGQVECDAAIVDHLGRSGACGAVPNIKNPVSLAKLILNDTAKPMSLRRTPPNILVGDGAKDFAESHGMKPVDNDHLISKNAKHRFEQWTEDLAKAERLADRWEETAKYSVSTGGWMYAPGEANELLNKTSPPLSNQLGDHANAILTGTWNEGQVDSPSHSSPGDTGEPQTNLGRSPRSLTPAHQDTPVGGDDQSAAAHPQGRSPSPDTKRVKVSAHSNEEPALFAPETSAAAQALLMLTSSHDGSTGHSTHTPSSSNASHGTKRPHSAKVADIQPLDSVAETDQQDHITDTVGAIAIDKFGHIAAAASSGGIGMKHNGRVGPAALVGIGAAIIPEDPDDKHGTTVAAVTSGTGEHMVPTMASHKCAERLYHSTRRGARGVDVEEPDEEAIMNSFIVDDFMAHPGVKHQHTAAAIGVMAVKKTNRGYYLYFSHNTDSFALASMSSKDREPLCVMSRKGEILDGPTHGARKIPID